MNNCTFLDILRNISIIRIGPLIMNKFHFTIELNMDFFFIEISMIIIKLNDPQLHS